MNQNKYILTLFFFLSNIVLFGQNFDQIKLNAGAIIKGKLSPQEQDYKSIKKVRLMSPSGKEKNIPLTAINTITLANGTVVYPIPQKSSIEKHQQVLSMYDTVFLKTGFAMPCTLNLIGVDISVYEKIPIISTKGVQKQIPKQAISKIKNKKGEIIFPLGFKEKTKLETKPEPVKPQINCYKETELLRREITNYALDKFNAIQAQIKDKTDDFAPASYDMEHKVKDQIYNHIRAEIEKLKEYSTSIDALITIKVDKNGQLLDYSDKIISSNYPRFYTQIRDNQLYPYLDKISFPTNKITIDYTGEYDKMYSIYKNRIESSNCKDEFNDVLARAKKQFASLEKSFKNTNTIYKISIKYNFSSVYQKWTYFNDVLRVKTKGSNYVTITRNEVRNAFLSKVKYKQKNARYRVNANYFSMLGDSTNISVNTVKRKYKYLTHFGVTMQGHYSFGTGYLSPSLGEIYTYNAKIIFHKIGFFGGGLLNLSNHKERSSVSSNLNGKFIQKVNPLYIEGGLYIGIGQYFFLKGGATYLKASFSEYTNSVLINNEDIQKIGFTGGMALIFPFFQIEAGYNSVFNSFYAGAGLHITLNE